MKHQYVGDINDYRKYALLRALSTNGSNRIGVCWMLTPSDGSSEGNKLAYLEQPERYRPFDPGLFDTLAHAVSAQDPRRLQIIEESAAIPGALYQNDLLPDDPAARHSFIARCASAFSNVDLIFFDPDNGLEVALPKGRRNSSKYLYLDEVTTFFDTGKSLLIYQHFPRIERSAFINSCVERLRSAAPRAAIWTYTTAHVVFLLLIHPESPARLAFAAMLACERWGAEFIAGRFLGFEPPTL